MASLNGDFKQALGQFAAECESAGMRIITSKIMVFSWKWVDFPLQVGCVSPVERSRKEQESYSQIGAMSADDVDAAPCICSGE